jgi:hypothetical protein
VISDLLVGCEMSLKIAASVQVKQAVFKTTIHFALGVASECEATEPFGERVIQLRAPYLYAARTHWARRSEQVPVMN